MHILINRVKYWRGFKFQTQRTCLFIADNSKKVKREKEESDAEIKERRISLLAL